MKKINLLIVSILFFGKIYSQSNVNADCINAIPLCNTPSFTFFATSGPGAVVDFSTGSTVSNPVNNPFPPNSGCLKSGELNPQWLLLTVGNAGMLEFVFGAANSANPQAGCYDWAMWPYNSTTCADILNNTLPPIRCNWNGTCADGTGIASATNIAAVGGNAVDFEPPLAVNACQQFIICISNYSGVNTLVSFQSLGTASLSCNPNCNPNYAICAGSSATIQPVNFAALSNPVFSIQPGGQSNTTGSFVVSPTVTTTYSTFITGSNQVNAVQTITALSTVTVYAQPVVAPTATQPSCSNSLTTLNVGLTFTPGPASPSYSISWSPIPNGINTITQTSVTGYIPGGSYNATVMTANGCSATVNYSVDPTPEVPEINLNPLAISYTATCAQPIINLQALDAANSYTWNNGLIAPIFGNQAQMTFTTTGTWTITAQHPLSGCIASKTIVVGQSNNAPTAFVTPLSQNITCSLTSVITITATASPSVNVTHEILAPQGGTFSANSYSTIYTPGGVGTYTHCAINDANGCRTCSTFTVTSNQGFPNFNVSSPQNFSLGCTTKSVATINIVNGSTTPPGGPVSYTILGPPTSTSTPSGSLSAQSTYTVNTPGTWTIITKDNTNLCQTRIPISILQNTFTPDISAQVPLQILDCNTPKTVLRGQSANSNISYLWSFPGVPGNLPSDSITVNADFSVPIRSVVAQYTLTITDNNSTCKSTSVVPIYQNLYKPNVAISNGGVTGISCKTPTLVLTNQSSSGIPPGSMFPITLPSVGYLWSAPSPQDPLQLSTTYLAAQPGTYTLLVRDMNNGCFNTGTISISDNRDYPSVNNPVVPPPSILDCATGIATLTPIVTNSNASYGYTMTPPAGITPKTGSLTGTKPFFITDSPGSYRILTVDQNNGCATLVQMEVINGTMTAGFIPDRTSGFAPLSVTFSNTSSTFTNASTNTLTLNNMTTIWNFGNGTSTVTPSRTVSPVVNYKAPGIYEVKIYVSKGTCSSVATNTITVDIPSTLEIPNVFTPNGDHVNDEFFLRADNLTQLEFSVSDRWGKEVYHVESTSGNVLWDGKNMSGKDVAAGVYFYTLKAKGLDLSEFEKNGTITLIR